MEKIYRLTTKIPIDLDEALCQFIRQMLFAMRQNWWVQRYGVFVSMPNFTLQKREGRLDPLVEKAIMKMQKKTPRHTKGLACSLSIFARLRISTYQLHVGMIFITLFLHVR